MPHVLLLSVHLHDGRFHGRPEWPPSPARLFQALVAGAARGQTLGGQEREALTWLEEREPPVIAAPAVRIGTGFSNYVPNNDLDAVGGDPARVNEIRVAKLIKPLLFEAGVPLLYAWRFEGETTQAEQVCEVARRLYQLGRGVDMAWAVGEVLPEDQAVARLASHPGALNRPGGSSGRALSCPAPGSLASLVDRHAKSRARFKAVMQPDPTRKDPARMKAAGQTFAQPPRARFLMRPYDSPPVRLLYDLRVAVAENRPAPQSLTTVVRLVEWVRDRAEAKLKEAQPERAGAIARVFIGRDATDADKSSRIRIMPLPSIGHAHVDRAIRRLLVEVPPDCPISPDDVHWAFSGVEWFEPTTGEILWNLVPAAEHGMLRRYGVDRGGGEGHRNWRTVTPAALPVQSARRRIDPSRPGDKGAAERLREEGRAVASVRQALRHAHTVAQVDSVRVQREPFEARGARAEAFAAGTRFAKERLWHVEIGFATAVHGPIAIGDGRYLGLGVMAPIEGTASIFVFETAALAASEAVPVARALRRAVMARVRDHLGKRADEGLPPFFSGHAPDGAPADAPGHEHLFFAVEAGSPARLLVIAPHRAMRRAPTRWEGDHLRTLEAALSGLSRLVCGRTGAHRLTSLTEPGAGSSLLGPAREWESCTPYRPTRHAGRGKDTAAGVVRDVLLECERRNLPRPAIELQEVRSGGRGGNVAARLRLHFAVAVEGPILLGRDSHMGGGLFAAIA